MQVSPLHCSRFLVLAFVCSCFAALLPSAGAQTAAPGTGRYWRRHPTHELKEAVEAAEKTRELRDAELSDAKDSAAEAESDAKNQLAKVVQDEATLAAAQTSEVQQDTDALTQAQHEADEFVETWTRRAIRLAKAKVALAEAQSALDLAKEAATTGSADEPNWFLPTTLCDRNPKTCEHGFLDDPALVNNFFNTSTTNPVNFVTKAQYTYSDASTINNLSSDLTAVAFPFVGIQLVLGGNATNAPAGSGQTSSVPTTTPTAASIQQAIQELSQGGDFYLRATLPLLYTPASAKVQMQAYCVSTTGFEFKGNRTQNTMNTASRTNNNVLGEGYFQWDAYQGPGGGESVGSVYADGKIEWEKISSGEAENAGLGSTTSFKLAQIILGISLNGFARISAQRYWGPKQLYVDSSNNPVTVNNFNKWQVGIQVTPALAKSKPKS